MILGGTNNTADGSGDLSGLSRAELHERMLAAETAARQAKADYYELCAEAKRRKGPSIHQHRNEALWLADSLRMAKGAAGAVLNRGSLLFSTHPELGAAFRDGRIGEHHLDLFWRIWNKPCLRPFLARDLDGLIRFASYPWYECRALFATWEELVDPIDPNDHAAKAYADRSMVTTDPVQQQVLLEVLTTTAVYATVEPALKVLVDELFEADWADARARVGDDATMDDLLRTDTQRRHDALFRLIRNGIGADPSTTNVCADIVADHQTLADEAEQRDAAARGEEPVRRPLTSEEVMERVTTRRCHTTHGRSIAPADALDFAIAGRVQLFVMNTATRDFTRSEKQRLFGRDQRIGALIRDRHCQSPGCDTSAVHCQADHTIRHTDGGPTVPTNLTTVCAPCHRHKTRLENLGLWPPST
ncbi:MAG: DUF222 domain-containing protein [Acidimicrobiales bacterium]